jgi:cellulose synthase/poly-beta-1,6-N-acetylglucosamine synthase-like glycosyltransferase
MMNHLLLALFSVGASFLIFYLLLPFVTTLLAQFFPKKEKKPAAPISTKNIDFGCVITCYKNADIARPLVESLLRQTHQNFHIYLLADECPKLDWTFDDPRFHALQPDPPLRLKAKSIIYAMENFQRKHDFTVVFDGDNLAHPDFLEIIQKYILSGFDVVQGQRTAKNLETRFAAMDSLGEFYKNWVERVVPFRLGSSAVISGSGMAVETELYWEYLRSPEIEIGKTQWKKMLQEDKILQNFLLRKKSKIAFAWNALCFDEKISTGDAAQTQRSRWLFSYFQNIPNSLGLLGRSMVGFSWNQFLFGLITFGLPMFILLGFSILFATIGLFFAPKISILLFASCAIFALNVLWTLQLSEVPKQVWQAIWSLPAFVGRQFLGLFKMFNPNKNFKHTETGRAVSIEEILKK